MNLPTPAIVAERGAQRLPRLALLLFCAAYVLPGLFGRDPWRNADLSSFGFMASIAQGHASWWQPAIAGIPAEGGPMPYWLGALAIKAMPFADAAFAARLPFTLAPTKYWPLVLVNLREGKWGKRNPAKVPLRQAEHGRAWAILQGTPWRVFSMTPCWPIWSKCNA